MDSDQLIMMGAICVIVYLAGYKAIAVGMFILMVVASVITPSAAKKPTPYGGVSVKGAEMLEPIVIETTRGAPFRIPAKMKIRMNPYWGATPWHVKIGKHLGRLLRWGYVVGNPSDNYGPMYPPKKGG